MRSMNVILDKSNYTNLESMLNQKYFQMLPLKMDPSFGLYKVKLFEQQSDDFIDLYDSLNNIFMGTDDQCSIPYSKLTAFSITELNNDPNENGVQKAKETEHLYLKVNENIEIKEKKQNNNNQNVNGIQKGKEELIMKEKEQKNLIPIMYLSRESMKNGLEIIASLINYKSPLNFRVRQYNSNFDIYLNKIKSNLNLRHVLSKYDLVKNMYVIFQNSSDSMIHRAQIIDMDSGIEKIKLLLVDEGNEVINEMFNNIILYNFIESDCNFPAQLVLDCSLNNMWFPSMSVDTSIMLQPYFDKKQLYKVLIIKSDESGTQFVQMIQKDTNIDLSEIILESGIGQRLCAAIKTDENPYEESLLKSQSFLSYVLDYHFQLCIQPEPNTVDELEEEILLHINNDTNLDFNNLQQDSFCLATVNNNQWYRALIISINKSAIVNLFDIGLMTEVSLKQIRPITNDLMRKPQLCLSCHLEYKELDMKIVEKKLYNVTVKSIDTNGKLWVSIKEHHSTPLSNPIVRGIELISFVHVDGDLTYLQRSQDKLKIEKMSETLSKFNEEVENKQSVVPGDICFFESHGKYYRCWVESIFSKMAVVHCIDFGYEKQVEMKKLKCLKQSKIALVPALLITVKTFPMASNMSQTMFLANMSVEDDGTLIAMPNKMTSIHTQEKLMETLKNGCLVKVTCVNSINDCWIVPHLYFGTLETISNSLVQMQSKIIPVVTEVGSLCAALHSKTKEWCRALILDKDSETGNMLSIDSGERFNALKTTRLVSQIQNIPNCALRCCVVSNVNIKKLLNKNVRCKLISCTQPLLEVELFSEDLDETEISSTISVKEWTVIVKQFESFDTFYVQKIDENVCLNDANINNDLTSVADKLEDFSQQPPAGTIVAALTDREDGVWYQAEVLTDNDNTNIIVRLLIDGSICKSIKIKVLPANLSNENVYYKCCIEEIVDSDLNDPIYLPIISDVMKMSKWKMKTSSVKEPYKVSLTCDDKNCIDIIYSVLISESCKSENNELLIEEINIEENVKCNTMLIHKSFNPASEYLKTNLTEKNYSDNGLIIPDIETVLVKYILSFRYFHVFSESLSMLYMHRITNDLDVSIVELTMNQDLIGSIVVTFSRNLNCWCRAKVDKILQDRISAYCYLVDFGTFEDCMLFYKPTDFLCMCPPLVRRCSLYTPMLDGKENEIWFSDINDMFRDIINIDGIKFDMNIKVNGDPCMVSLQLGNIDVAEMLNPMNVQLSYVKSLTDFKVTAISDEQRALVKLLKSKNIGSMIFEENPLVDNMYLAIIESTIKRVKYSTLSGTKFLVIDIDDTLDVLSVDSLYKLPETIRNCPIFTMSCSLIIKDKIENYSLSKFQKLADTKCIFIMCIIIENNGITNNLVKLYLNHKDVLDYIKI
uniref:Tudor domain-containing protein n=1 Tax=Sipha flava TaxID=143950 RepID=A0A2S2R5N5_9HEMI